MPFILALDQGTTSSRAIVFDDAGAIRAAAHRELRQIYPQPGWVEHDPLDIWQTQLATGREALARARVPVTEIAAIGITNQRETTLLWDRRTGQPLHNAIVWQDRRTADRCNALRKSHAAFIQRRTGLIPDAYFSASKLEWLLDHIPNARRRSARGELAFGTVDSWLLWNLTAANQSKIENQKSKIAIHATDVSNASRTMLFNIHTCRWDDELLELFNIPREVLPEVRDSSGHFGETIHFGGGGGSGRGGIPITGIAGDQQAALFGQNCLAPGLAKNTYGTGCFLLMNTGPKPHLSRHQLLTTIAWSLPASSFQFPVSRFESAPSPKRETRKTKRETHRSKLETRNSKLTYALEGSVFVGGAVVQWLRDGLGLIKSAADIEKLARSVPDSGGVYLVPAFAGLGAPHWDQYARGTIAGITRGTTAAHLARAALDAIAFQVADLLDTMHADSAEGGPLRELRVDGGAARNNLLLQFQADLLRIPVVRPAITETTALGAAFLAGLGAGLWKRPTSLARLWKADATFEPQLSAGGVARRRDLWNRALERARDWEEPTKG